MLLDSNMVVDKCSGVVAAAVVYGAWRDYERRHVGDTMIII